MDDHQLPPASKELGPHKGGEAYLGYAEAGRYVYEQHEAREPGGFLEYWRLLCRYKVIIVGMTVLGAVAGILLTLTQQPVYQARAAIEIQNINEDFLNIKQVSPVSKGDNSTVLTEIQTQMRLLQSESLIKRVLTKLKDRTFEEPQVSTIRLFVWRKALHLPEATLRDEPDPDAAAGSLKVRASGPTRVVEISYDSKNPHFAAAFVNTLVQEFIESTMEARLKGSAYTSEWLSRELEDMRIKLQHSEDALQSYARRAGLMFTSEKTNISEEKLRQLQEQLSRTQADRIAAQSRWEITKISPPDALPDVLNDSLLRSLQEKLTELRRQQAELITIYTENHNKVKQVEAQIAPLEAALQRERSAIIERLRNDYEAALRREKLLAADFAKQSGLVTDEAEKSIQYGILKREVDSNREIYASMLQRVKEARIASAVRASNIRIIDAAEPPEYPYKPSLPINGALGLFSGLCIGAAVAIMRGRADRTLQAPGEARFWLKVPELQVIPAAPRTLRRRLHPSLMAESFRSLLTSILFSGDDGESPQALVLTSPGPGEGKTIIASNLGIALARIQRKVLIIDGDLRKPRMHELFDLPNDRGFSSLLCHSPLPENQLKGIVQETSIPGLSVLTSGPAIESAADLLYSADLSELLAEFKTEFDFVIIDTPPMSQMPDARVLARLADAVILVTRAGHTTRQAAEDAYRRLIEDKARVLGTVLNDWNPKNGGRYYGHGYNYPN